MSIKYFSGADLKVGDKVIVYTSYMKKSKLYIGEITRKTPTGLLDVKYKGNIVERFKDNGNPYNKSDCYSFRQTYLMPYSEERAQEIQRDRDRERMLKYLSEMDWSIYSNEELDNILRYLSRIKIEEN